MYSLKSLTVECLSRIEIISFPYLIIIHRCRGRNSRLIGVVIVKIEAAANGRFLTIRESDGYFAIKG